MKKAIKNINMDSNIINIKIENEDQVISKFSYDKNDKLNTELSNFIVEKSKNIPVYKDIELHFYSSSPLNQTAVKQTLQNHFKDEYVETLHDLRRSNIFSLVMLILGLLSLTALILATKFLNNFITSTILEIASWVFIWEAVNNFFIKRGQLRHRCLHIKKLYYSTIKIVVEK